MLRPAKQRTYPKSEGRDYAILPRGDDDDGDAARLPGGGAWHGGSWSSHDELLPTSTVDEYAEELRLYAFRELLLVGRPPRSPRYDEARPKHFPSEINVFLTGGLYTSIHKAMVELVPYYNKAYLFLYAFLLTAFMVAFRNNPILYQIMEEDGRRRLNYRGYVYCALGMYVVSTIASFLITRPLVERYHNRVEAVVQEMSPLFRRVGYDLEYHRRDPAVASAPWWVRLRKVCDQDSFVRIVSFRGEPTPNDAARADALWEVKRRVVANPTEAEATAGPAQPRGEFRVAAYGIPAFPGKMGFGREPNLVSIRSFQQFSDRIDECTWGAVSTEMRAYAERHRQSRFGHGVAMVVLFSLPAWMPRAFSSWFVVTLYAVLSVCYIVFLFHPAALEASLLKRAGGISEIDEMQATIQRLSPLVQERSGYALRLDTEPEGCLGGTCAYVCFVPAPASSV